MPRSRAENLLRFAALSLAACSATHGEGEGPTIGDGGEVHTPTSFTLTSRTSGMLPFTIGLGFGRGDVPSTFALDLADAQVEVKRRWNDGSVKHAVVSGLAELTGGQPRTVHIMAGRYVGGDALTCADIASKDPAVTASFGSYGTVALHGLLAAPVRTWLTGPAAVECHYAAPVGSDPTLRARFAVRLYRGGRMFVRVIAENGYLDRATATASYVPQVTIGGAKVFDNGGQALTHHAHTRWLAEGWIGGDPDVLGVQDPIYLRSTRLVPNYWVAKRASSAALDGFTQAYVPMDHGDWTPSMGAAGYQAQIGLLPNWDAMVFTSGGDARAVRASIANAKALGSYPIVWRDTADDLPTRPDGRPSWTVDGAGEGGENGWGAGSLIWEAAHHPSGGYLAYLLTGDYLHLETMQHQASLVYLVESSSHGLGPARILSNQTRGSAWSQRTIGQLAAIGPGDVVTESYRALMAANATHFAAVASALGPSSLGIVYDGNLNAYAPGTISPWQQNFYAQTYGHLRDLEPTADMAAIEAVSTYLAKIPVGLLGAGGGAGFCFTRASTYTIQVGAGTLDELSQMFRSWREVDVATSGGGACGTTLGGDSGGAPQAAAEGYWGNLLPAIAFAVDHGAPGAAAAWQRLTTASNWNAIEGATWADSASWAIVPRSF